MTVLDHLLHSVTRGNLDGNGRYSSLWSPHSLHGHCRNLVYKRLRTYRVQVYIGCNKVTEVSKCQTMAVFYLCNRQFPFSCHISHCSTCLCPSSSECKSPHNPDLVSYPAPLMPSFELLQAHSHQFHPLPIGHPLCEHLSSNILG